MAIIPTDTTLRIERTFPATRERVFEAWTQAEALSHWFAPSAAFEVRVPTLDLRPGGEYLIEMRRPDGTLSTATGRYLEITPPSRLVFTWNWQEQPEWGESTVTIALEAHGLETRLTLVHERLATAELRDQHEQGCVGCLAQLASSL